MGREVLRRLRQSIWKKYHTVNTTILPFFHTTTLLSVYSVRGDGYIYSVLKVQGVLSAPRDSISDLV